MPSTRSTTVDLGRRSLEIQPVGAWVQPGPGYERNGHGHIESEAVVSAALEERRMQRRIRVKEEQLRNFREEVKTRVRTLVRLKNQQQLQSSFKAVELERKVVSQSSSAAETVTPRRNSCMKRQEDYLSIGRPNQHLENTNNSALLSNERPIEEHIHRVKKFTRQARRNLTTRQLLPPGDINRDLPGGVWRESFTREHPAASRLYAVPDATEDSDHELTLPCDDTYIDNVQQERLRAEEMKHHEPKVVRFDDQPGKMVEDRSDRIRRKSVCHVTGSDVERPLHVPPDVNPGVSMEDEKRQLRTQRAMSRRLFMDIEREQVKENTKRKEHREKIAKLKSKKEQERRRIESESYKQVTPKDPATGETVEQIYKRQLREQSELRKTLDQQTLQAQKAKESERYVEALRRNVKDRAEKLNIVLPPLCCCGQTVWDTHPDLCANNCIFYKNPKAYTKALQSLLTSYDLI